MCAQAKLRGSGGEIVLSILGYENISAGSVDDANWLRAQLDVRSGPFYGSVECAITTYELLLLQSQLVVALKTLTTAVHFGTMEDNWQADFTFERSGTATVVGTIIPTHSRRAALQYEIETDPISLETWVRELAELQREYPVKEVEKVVFSPN